MSLKDGEITKVRSNITTSNTDDTLIRLDTGPQGPGFIYPNRIWVAATATVVLVNIANQVIQLEAMIPGRWHNLPPNIKRINASGTTATAIHVATTIG